MKKNFLLVLMFFVFILSFTPTQAYNETTPYQVTLWAGQNIEVGTASVWNDELNLYIKYETINEWYLLETHLHVATNFNDIPQTPSGNPKIGLFTYSNTFDPLITEFLYTISLNDWNFGDMLYIAAHAVVQKIENDVVIQEETAWADGDPFSGNNWATYFWFILEKPEEPPINPGDFRTQTQGGWGTEAKGNNPGTYRDANFASVFPSGLTIGHSNGFTVLLSTSQVVESFLPQGGTPGTLIKNHVDPESTEAGVLAGQVVALTLNVYFDFFDPNFGLSASNLQDLIISDNSSPFKGWTVLEILEEANLILAGLPSAYTPAQINDAVTSINENFVDGIVVGTFLKLALFEAETTQLFDETTSTTGIVSIQENNQKSQETTDPVLINTVNITSASGLISTISILSIITLVTSLKRRTAK
ncbi:hypothetical protein [Candidatus Hodarchaeum mangrovi]